MNVIPGQIIFVSRGITVQQNCGTKRVMVFSDRRFGTTRRSHLQGSSGPRRMPGIIMYAVIQEWCTPPSRNVGNHHFRLRNIPEEQRPHLHRG